MHQKVLLQCIVVKKENFVDISLLKSEPEIAINFLIFPIIEILKGEGEKGDD